MSIKVKGFLKDVGGASRVTKLREENFAKGSPIPDPHDPIRELADKGLFRVETLAESGRWFRKHYPLTPVTAVTVSSSVREGISFTVIPVSASSFSIMPFPS